MKETFIWKKEENYQLFLQVTDYSHAIEVITIIYFNNTVKEDKNEYTPEDFSRLNHLLLTDGAKEILENDFAVAQDIILSKHGTTRRNLKDIYGKIWYDFYNLRYKIEQEVIDSGIDLSHYGNVLKLRYEKELHYNLDALRNNLNTTFVNYGGEHCISNKDIFSKTASEMTEIWLKVRNELLLIASEKIRANNQD